MADRVTLYKAEYLVGSLNEDLSELEAMILRNYNEGRNIAHWADDIRYEDIRINFTPQVQRIARTLEQEWFNTFGDEIELCWQGQEGNDPNSAFWSVVHAKGEMTNLHSHESADNYVGGAHVSAAFYVKVPPNSGDFVFQYKPNPYIIKQEVVKAEPNKFVMFDSTMPHFVTKNHSDDLRIVISMNFRFKNNEDI
jgi:hypothetical protein